VLRISTSCSKVNLLGQFVRKRAFFGSRIAK
jgi:hypothetical protein